MSFRLNWLLLLAWPLLVGAAARAADPVELRPLKGEPVKGELVSISDKEIVLKVGDKPVATPAEQVLVLDVAPATGAKDAKYTEVELADGSLLRASTVTLKGKQATLTLLSGQNVTVPMTSLTRVTRDAGDVKLAAAWKSLFAGKKRNYDVVVAKTPAGGLNQLEGTFYDATEDGARIEFAPRGSDVKAKLVLENIHGLVFLRPPDPNLPPLVCKLTDTQGGTLMAKSVVLADGKLTVTTQAGVPVEYPVAALARLDYSKGKETYLSDLEPARVQVVEANPLGLVMPLRKDRNLDGEGPIQIGGKVHAKGLSLHAYCELTFDLEGGDYREFRAVAGIDDRVGQGSDGPTLLRIEGDGKELKALSLTRKDGAVSLVLNIRDVQKLKVVVSSDDPLALGRHLALGSAKVTK